MSQSFIKRPDNGPHSALAGLGVLKAESLGAVSYSPPPHMDAKALIERAARLLDEWERKYGEHCPHWLPPAGLVRWREDAAAYIAAHTLPAPAGGEREVE